MAVESVLTQTYREFELLVWDDGSTDNSFDLASQFDLRVFRGENRGVAYARNQMLSHAKFDLIALIDHDDTWAPTKLAEQVPVFDSKAVILAHSNCNFVESSGETKERKMLPLPPDRPFDHILSNNRIVTSSVVLRKSALLEIGGFKELTRCSDWLAWFELASMGQFVYDPKILVDYAIRPRSLANSGFEFHLAQLKVLDEFVLPRQNQLYRGETSKQQRRYRRLARQSSGVALSSMSSCMWKANDTGKSKAYALQAVRRAPRVFRVWTRLWRAFTTQADRPR